MAKARDLKGVNKTVDQLTKDLENLQSQPATARRAEAEALHAKLTNVKALLDNCPDGMFRMFAEGEPIMAAAPRRKTAKKAAKKTTKKKTARKSSRKGTRKVR